jgi:hypothetical protein
MNLSTLPLRTCVSKWTHEHAFCSCSQSGHMNMISAVQEGNFKIHHEQISKAIGIPHPCGCMGPHLCPWSLSRALRLQRYLQALLHLHCSLPRLLASDHGCCHSTVSARAAGTASWLCSWQSIPQESWPALTLLRIYMVRFWSGFCA